MTSLNGNFEKHVSKLLLELPPRARNVVKRRYGIGSPSSLTLEAIGKKEGITRERVRQIENDAMRKLKKSQAFLDFGAYEDMLVDLVEQHGGIIAQDELLASPELREVKDKKTVLFFLDLSDKLKKRKTDDYFHVRWFVGSAPIDKVEESIISLDNELAKSHETLSLEAIVEKLNSHLKKNGVTSAKSSTIESYLSLAKNIAVNAWGEYGHVESPFVRPRGMRESAFVALQRERQPLHFKEIAEKIGEFTSKPVHVQTVHNELIKDDRFVLVGRGLYALREWGYEPGFIKDVIVRLLAEQGAMSREEILEEVSKRRQVKPSTILINLQNKKYFKSLDNGTYTLVS